MSLGRSIGRSTLIHGVGVLAQRIAGFLMLPLYTRRLDRAEYGQLALIDFVVGLVALIVGLSIADALARIHDEQENDDDRRRAVATAVLGSGALAAASAVLLSLLGPLWVPAVLGEGIAPGLVALALTTMALDAFSAPVYTYLRILDRPLAFVSFSLTRLVLAVTLNLLLLGVLDIGIAGYFLANVLASGALAALLLLWVRREVPLLRPSRDHLVRLVRFSAPLVPASLCSLVLHGAGRWVLSREGALAALGVYSVAFQMGNVVSSGVIQPFNLVWGTKVYEVARLPDGRERIARAFLWFGFILAWAAVGLSLLSPPLLRVWVGPEFRAAASAVPFVALGYVFFGLAFVVHFGILWSKRTTLSLRAAAIAAVANVALVVALVRILPEDELPLAPAIAGAVAFATLAALRDDYARRLLPIAYPWGRMVALIALGAALVAAPELVALSRWADVGARLLLALAFGPLALAARLLPWEDVIATIRPRVAEVVMEAGETRAGVS